MIRKGLKIKKKHLRSRTWDKIRSEVTSYCQKEMGEGNILNVDAANESSLMVMVIGK